MQRTTALVIGIIVATVMAAAVVYGFAAGDFGEEFGAVLDLAWGRVSLVDLAAGLVLIGSWIAWREGSIARAVPWWLALIVTGNLASGGYVAAAAWRAPDMVTFLAGDRRLGSG